MNWLIVGLAFMSLGIIAISSGVMMKHLNHKKKLFKAQHIEYLYTPMPIEIKVDCDFNLDLTTVERGVVITHEPITSILKDANNQEYNSWVFKIHAKPRSLISFEVHAENLNPNYGFRAEILTPYNKIITSSYENANYINNIQWISTEDYEQEPDWIWCPESILEHYSPEKNKYDIVLYDIRL